MLDEQGIDNQVTAIMWFYISWFIIITTALGIRDAVANLVALIKTELIFFKPFFKKTYWIPPIQLYLNS